MEDKDLQELQVIQDSQDQGDRKVFGEKLESLVHRVWKVPVDELESLVLPDPKESQEELFGLRKIRQNSFTLPVTKVTRVFLVRRD